MKISGICLVSENVPRLTKFYETLFGITSEGDDNYSYFIIENTTFSICAIDIEKKIAPKYNHIKGNNCIIEITVTDIETYYDTVVNHKMKVVKPLKTESFGTTSFWLQDLDENIVSIIKA